MRLRKRAAGLALGAGILFLLGTNVQAGWLFVLCALMLGTLASGLILPGRMLRGIEVERRAPAEVVQGEEAFVDLIVTNRARGIRLGLIARRPARGADEPVSHEGRRPASASSWSPSRPARKRGVQEDSMVTVRSAAPFGVAERRRTLRVAGSTIVLPAVVPLGPLPFLAHASRSEPLVALRAAPRVRARVPGDPRVPARATARATCTGPRPPGPARSWCASSRRSARGGWRSSSTRSRDVGDESARRSTRAAPAAASIARGGDRGRTRHRARSRRAPGGRVDVCGRRRRGSAPSPARPRSSPTAMPLAEIVDLGAEAFRGRRRASCSIFPTWRTNGDGALARAIAALAGRRARPSSRSRSRSAPDDAKRIAALRPTRSRRSRRRSRGRAPTSTCGVTASRSTTPSAASRWRRAVMTLRERMHRVVGPARGLGRDARRRRRRRGGRDPRRGRAGRRERRRPRSCRSSLAPVGYVFSYRQRHQSNITTKVLLSVGLLAAFAAFLQSVQLAGSVDQARVPLASLFLWVQVLHAFDVPRRRDLAFSMVSSVILMAEAGALSLSSSFGCSWCPWAALGGGWLFLSSRPRSAVTTRAGVGPTPVARRAAARGGVGPRRGLGRIRRPCSRARCVFMGIPRLPGHARPFAAVLARRRRVDRGGLRRRRGEPVAAGRVGRRRRGLRAERATRGSATSSTCGRAGTSRTRSRSGCATPQAALWRAEAFDTFDGTMWTISNRTTDAVAPGRRRQRRGPAARR